jgi:hypothetical protein
MSVQNVAEGEARQVETERAPDLRNLGLNDKAVAALTGLILGGSAVTRLTIAAGGAGILRRINGKIG